MFIVFSIIITKLVMVQVVESDTYKDEANKKAVTELQDYAPRGKITDCTGHLEFASTKQSYILEYIDSDEGRLKYIDTMDKVYKILEDNGETVKDDFGIKLNPMRFDFNVQEEDPKKAAQITSAKQKRFLIDHGFQDTILRKMLKTKDEKKKLDEYLKDNSKIPTDLKKKINTKLMAITPKDAFKTLWDKFVSEYVDAYVGNMGIKDKDKKKAKKAEISKKINKKYATDEAKRKLIITWDTATMQSYTAFKPVTIASNIKKDTAFTILERLNELPGIDVTTQPIRTYPYGELGSAFLGYISKITSDDQGTYAEKGYDVNSDYIGISGIESAFESRLKGSKGSKIVKLNSNGRIIEELGKKEPSQGQTIKLTIDGDLQYVSEKALDDVMKKMQQAGQNPYEDLNTTNATRGAIVVENVKTGAILSMASRPGYDPSMFTSGGLSKELYNKYFNPDLEAMGKSYIESRGLLSQWPGMTLQQVLDTLFPVDTSIKGNKTIRSDTYDIFPKPFMNYATQSVNPPGSTFKPMTAISGLESGAINQYFTVDDEKQFIDETGRVTKFPAEPANHIVNVTKALEVSSNPFFMTVGQRLRQVEKTNDVLAKYSWKFGLGYDPSVSNIKGTGIEIAESHGQVYNTATLKGFKAQEAVWNIMTMLKNGKTDGNASFTPINLYSDDNDSDAVKNLKAKFKQDIIANIKNKDDTSTKAYTDALRQSNKLEIDTLTQLIGLDPKYKGKTFTDSDLNIIKNALNQMKYTAHLNTDYVYSYELYNSCIGQGISAFTPLELCNYLSTIVNGGTRYKAHLVDSILDANGKEIEKEKPVVYENTGISKNTIELVKEGMHDVTSGNAGTATAAFVGFPIPNGGKTGTATYKTDQDKYGRAAYAEYIGFAPYDDPEIAVCVVVFDGGHGGDVATAARAVYEQYFKQELKEKYPDYVPIFNYGTPTATNK